MPRHPVELAQKHYEELPAVLKRALFSTEIAEQMFEIGKKFGLTIEKTGVLAEETGYVMLGIARPNEFVDNLAGELGVDQDKAQEIAAEINHQIFFPLREEFKRTHNFDMGAAEILGSARVRVSGMHPDAYQSGVGVKMPPGIRKTFDEEKSPLVSELTRIQEQTAPQKTSTVIIPAKAGIQDTKGSGSPISAGGGSALGEKSGMTETSQSKQVPTLPPSFVPPASPTGRIADLKQPFIPASQQGGSSVQPPSSPRTTQEAPPVTAGRNASVVSPSVLPQNHAHESVVRGSPASSPPASIPPTATNPPKPLLPTTVPAPAASVPSRQPTEEEQTPSRLRFEPFASPSSSVADLQKMVEKTPQPPKPSGDSMKSSTVGAAEPWEKDMEQEVSALLTQKPTSTAPTQPKEPSKTKPIDLRPEQKPAIPPYLIPQTKTPPIDLRSANGPSPSFTATPPSVSVSASPTDRAAPPRMTPQLQDLGKNAPSRGLEKNLSQTGVETDPTLLQEKLRAEVQTKATPAAEPHAPITDAPGVGDPYREPIEETEV